MRYTIPFLLVLVSLNSNADDFCSLLETNGRTFIESKEALSCQTDQDCSYVSSDLLNCGCPGVIVGKGLKTYEALETVHEDICGISCIPECIVYGYRGNDKKMERRLFCENNLCIEKVVEVE